MTVHAERHKLPYILPVETQVREFDAKLLMACVAAEAGHEAYVGFQNEIRAQITALPRGVYIAKGFVRRHARFLTILQRLGFIVPAWDEEGLVLPSPAIYYKRRITPKSLAQLDALLSWGPHYTQLIRNMPFYDGTPIHETGNPRIDILRKEVRGFFDEDVAALKQRFGRYILLNSNFGRVNTLIKRPQDQYAGGKPTDGAVDQEWQEMMAYRRSLYEHFRIMLAGLANAFPDYAVILRPHPAEKPESWQDIEAQHANVKVLFEGNVAPWLLGAEILVQNGCTTAIESVLLDKPVLAYQPITSEKLDWHLPNSVSFSIQSLEDLVETTRLHLAGTKRLEVTQAQRDKLADFIHLEAKRLASDAIVQVIDEQIVPQHRPPHAGQLMLGWLDAQARTLEKRLRTFLPGDAYAPWHQEKHFPSLSLADVERRLDRLKRATGRFEDVRMEQYSQRIFRAVPARKHGS